MFCARSLQFLDAVDGGEDHDGEFLRGMAVPLMAAVIIIDSVDKSVLSLEYPDLLPTF